MGLLSGIGKAVSKVASSVTGGDLLSAGIGALGFFGQQGANVTSAANAAGVNMLTEKAMKRRHQWEVADLKAAGLNPILSAGGTPSIGSFQQPDVQNAIGAGISSGMAAKRMAADLEAINATIDKTKSDTALNNTLQQTSQTQQILNLNSAKAAAANANLSNVNAVNSSKFTPYYSGLNTAGASLLDKAHEVANRDFYKGPNSTLLTPILRALGFGGSSGKAVSKSNH